MVKPIPPSLPKLIPAAIEYDPYENREVDRPLSNFDAFTSVLKCVIGTGVLALPLAYMYSGIIGGTVLIILIAILLTYGMHLLIRCMVETCRRTQQGYVTYPKAMAFAFTQGPRCCHWMEKASGYVVDGVLGFAYYGTTVVYIVFVAQNWMQLSSAFVPEFRIGLRLTILIVAVLLLPLFLIRHLKYLVPFNMAANILMYMGFVGIFYYLCRGLPDITDRVMFGDPSQLPLFFGIVLFAVSSVGGTLAIESKMAKPEEFISRFGVLNKAIALIIITNLAFGLIGFWRYGDESDANITLNLPTDEHIAKFAKFAISLGVFLSYPLNGYITIDIIVNHYIVNGEREIQHPHIIEYIIRILFVIIGAINAMAFPDVGPLLGFVGAFTVSILNLIFPACMELCLLYNETYGKSKWKLWKDVLIIIIGIIILIVGSFCAILDMIRQYGASDLIKSGNNTLKNNNINTNEMNFGWHLTHKAEY